MPIDMLQPFMKQISVIQVHSLDLESTVIQVRSVTLESSLGINGSKCVSQAGLPGLKYIIKQGRVCSKLLAGQLRRKLQPREAAIVRIRLWEQ